MMTQCWYLVPDMSQSDTPTLDHICNFLEENPNIERIEAIFPTINGIARGKWIPVSQIEKLATQGIRLPKSTYALDCWGIDVEETGLGIVSGDSDGIGLPIAHTLSPIPWSLSPAAQIIMTMVLPDRENTPWMMDPRQQLTQQVDRLAKCGLRAVVAMELEFYLIKPVKPGKPIHAEQVAPFLDHKGGNLNNLDVMQVYEPVLTEIQAVCKQQQVDIDVAIAEAGMGQFELNFNHSDDALKAADQAFLFKRIVKNVARKHDMDATFMAKPFADDLGSGLHVHVSIVDMQGDNCFSAPADGELSLLLEQAVGGLLDSMTDMQAIFAPNLNAWRRLGPGSFAPSHANWGFDHRGVAIRIPQSSGKNARLEHRICGADANPYLVLSAILAGIQHGWDQKLDPGKAVGENTSPRTLHTEWYQGLCAWDQSNLAGQFFGEEFKRIYSVVRHHEYATLRKQISDIELALLIHSA